MNKYHQLAHSHLVLLALLVGGLLAGAVRAGEVDHRYEVSIRVLDQGDDERKRALREGLEQVMVRVSGQAEFQGSAGAQEALANPDAYLKEFNYSALTDAEKAEVKAQAEASTRLELNAKKGVKTAIPLPELKINATFSPEPIKAMLRKAGLPVWSSKRPSVLVWVVVDAGHGKQLLSQLDAAQAFLLQESTRRGLPVILPMNDLNDQVILGVTRLWDLDQVAIKEASRRYGEDSILVGRVAQVSPGEWKGNWLYLLKDDSRLVESSAEDTDSFLAEGIDMAVQMQVERYGISPTSVASKVQLDISGVDSLKRYADTLLFLKSLDPVSSVVVTEANGDVLHCSLDVDGGSRLLQELIALGHLLVSDDVIKEVATPDLTQTPALPVLTTQEAPRVLHYHLSTK